MDSYTITITPNDDSGNSTTLTVDTATGQARITSVHMHAPAGLTGAQLPSVDVGLLLQAVTGSTTTPAAISATPVVEGAPPPARADADEPSITAATVTPEPAAGDATPPTPAAPAKRASRRPAASARTAEKDKALSSGTRRGRKQPAPKTAAPSKTARKRVAAAAPAAESAERVYRKMPDDFAAVYRQAGTTAAIADHYGVPRYTAQGWIGRHKKQDAAAKN